MEFFSALSSFNVFTPVPTTAATLARLPTAIAQSPTRSLTRHFSTKLPAGFPSPATDHMEDGLDLNEHLIAHKAASFLFEVRGTSMRDAGILDGDKVVVDRSVTAKHGHIVVAVVNGDCTIKRLYRRAGRIELRPENPDFQPIKFADGDELQVWGVVVGVVRKYL